MQTRDLRELPFGYGRGSGTIATWLTAKAREVYNVGSTDEFYQVDPPDEFHQAPEGGGD